MTIEPDIALCPLNGEPVAFHRAILAAFSDAFRALLSSQARLFVLIFLRAIIIHHFVRSCIPNFARLSSMH
jgi:hypothetical protein